MAHTGPTGFLISRVKKEIEKHDWLQDLRSHRNDTSWGSLWVRLFVYVYMSACVGMGWSSVERGRRAAARVMARMVMVAAVPVPGRCTPTRLLVTPASVIGWETLDDSIPGEHAPIDREVPAHHEGSHSSILLGQAVRFVG